MVQEGVAYTQSGKKKGAEPYHFTLDDYQGDLMRHMGELSAYIVHEVRNPLQTVRAFIQTIERLCQENEKIKRYVPLIMGELCRMEDLLNDFLRFSRPISPKFALLDLKEICQDTVTLMRGGAVVKGVHFVERYQNVPPIMGDSQRLRQLLLNLLINAMDACQKGGAIQVVLEHDEREVHLRVVDDGCGIEQEAIERIFDQFYSTKEKGTGLGLSLAQAIVWDHNGTISVHSQVGQGSEFACHFPVSNSAIYTQCEDFWRLQSEEVAVAAEKDAAE